MTAGTLKTTEEKVVRNKNKQMSKEDKELLGAGVMLAEEFGEEDTETDE